MGIAADRKRDACVRCSTPCCAPRLVHIAAVKACPSTRPHGSHHNVARNAPNAPVRGTDYPLARSAGASGKGQALMDEWVRDANFWVRRAAMLHQQGWQLDTDRHRLFRFAKQLGGDTEFFVRKAIGRALRDFARWDAESVRLFVQCNMSILSPLTVREAMKRLQEAV